MQRLYSMFPTGPAGIGLIALRAAVILGLLTRLWTPEIPPSFWPMVGVVVLVLLIGLGALTPIACTADAVGQLLASPGGTGFVQTTVALLIAMALGVLGPGAYSLDAKLFGRRLIVPAD